ncbi:hypothetical protein Y1Q_0006545 [Alligator mississippiensis]|uniref:Uncharacterized protein n=1 Tax=Alligator mississippiensis TaxID=8496 RepID=A0A151M7E2_ALLMI|nr:hypothetical protein Y1Q_0006545 [Alligator mississippiensis]
MQNLLYLVYYTHFYVKGVKLEFSVSMEICNRMEPEDTTDTHLSGSRIPIGGIVCLTQLYHQKTVGEDGKEVAKTIWQMCHWHRLFEDIASPEEESGDVEEEIEASEEESGSSDNNNENSDSDDGEKDSERIMTFTKN